MIPLDYITEWRARAPWVQDFQVEQDLVISRSLVEIFSHPVLAEGLAFRGGTALYKLYLKPARYSEDIDLVQLRPEASGPIMDAFREVFDPWLSVPHWKQAKDGFTFVYRFDSEDTPPMRLRLKVEVNSREHFSVFGFNRFPFSVDSRWFGGTSDIVTYELDELLATKLRALYQRKKGRDLFDLAIGLEDSAVDPDRVTEAFIKYMARSGRPVTRALFERNLAGKLRDPQFSADIGPLLAGGHRWDLTEATRTVSARLIALLPGAPWEGEEQARLQSPQSRRQNREIPESGTSREHIIPLSLGGVNGFEIAVDATFNSKVGADIDGALANEFLIAVRRTAYDARGHSGKHLWQL